MGKEEFQSPFARQGEPQSEGGKDQASSEDRYSPTEHSTSMPPNSAPDASNASNTGEREHAPPHETELLTSLLERANMGVLLQEWAKLPFDKRRRVQRVLGEFLSVTEELDDSHRNEDPETSEWIKQFEANLRQRYPDIPPEAELWLLTFAHESASGVLEAQADVRNQLDEVKWDIRLNPDLS